MIVVLYIIEDLPDGHPSKRALKITPENRRNIYPESWHDISRDDYWNLPGGYADAPNDNGVRVIKENQWVTKDLYKEENKMGEIRKDRITLDASEGCYLELFNGSNTILFHFGTESREVTVPDDYEIDWGIKEMGTCDLHIKKKKPKLLNMKFTVKARPIFRQKYANTTNDICDSAISFPEPYEGASIRLVIKGGVVSTLSSDDELLAYNVGIWIPNRLGYTMDDIPFIERKIREAYNTRKIFPNATNGIEIIRDEVS
jgi:hypothetical protein